MQVQDRMGQIKHSQSLEKLMSCQEMKDTLELCEIFVILGPNEESLKSAVKESQSKRAAETPTSDQHEAASLNQAERASLSLQSVESSYMMVVNDEPSRKEPTQSTLIKVKPDIIDTYPSIYQDQMHYEDSAMHQLHPEAAKIKDQYLYLSNIQSICFPDGYYVDTEFTLDKIKQAKKKVMHLTITQQSGDKKFLTCLEYKELFMVPISDSDEKSKTSSVQRIPCLIPRILLLVSRLPFFTTHLQMLSLLHADLQVSFMQTFTSFYQLQHYSIEDCFQLASSQQRLGALEYYVSAFIHHYRIDGSHLQVEVGKGSSSQYKGGKAVIKYVNTFERRYGSLRIENYEFEMLFQRVRPQLLMQIFVALLHERKVILILGGYGDLSSEEDCCKNGAIIIETLLNLMYPLQWNFTNISNLIPSMIDYLEAPFPFILCVSRSLWRQIYETRWSPESCPLGDETLAFDLDTQKVYVRGQSQSMSAEAHLPELPQPYTQLLIQQLERQMLKTAEVRSLDISEEVFWKQFTLKVKQQFLNFLIFLINTFENFYNQDGLVHYPRGNSANEIFNFTDYMQNVQENRGFFKKFVQTQAFINFIEQAHTMQPEHDNDTTAKNQSTTQIFEPHLDFFKLCTRKLSKENIQAVRQMQDEIIANILSKYTTRGISYTLEKCLTLYEAQLKLSLSGGKPMQKAYEFPQAATLQIISKLNHDRIICMQPFDPKAVLLIQEKFNEQMPNYHNAQSKRVDVKHKEAANSIDMRAPIATTAGGGESTLRIVLGGGLDNQLRGGRQDLYFTGEATPKRFQSRAISQHPPLSRVIKVEDNMEVEEDSVKQHRLRSQENQLRDSNNFSPARHIRDAARSPSEEAETTNRIDLGSNDRGSEGDEEEVKGGGAGIIGFFKKTFSSVKKTFESTFNQQKPPATMVRNARPKSRVADETSRRPSLLLDDNEVQQSSPRIENMKSRVRFANEGSATVVNRATRSQTFHVTSTKNQKHDDQEGGFFANLFGFSARKQRNEENLDDKLRMNKTEQVANSKVSRKLNNSGFFVFNEEDMKKMTEMSPKDATGRNGALRATSLDFHELDTLPKPKIKSQSIFTTGGATYHSNRLRSISYQQPGGFSQTQSGLRVALNDKRYLEKERYVEESLQLIEQFPHKGQSNKNVMFTPMIGSGESRQISGVFQGQANAKSEVRKNQPPLAPQTPDQRLLSSQSTTSLMQKQRLLFNNPKSLVVQNQLSLIKEDPLNLSAQGGDSANPSPTAAANAASQRAPQNTSDFEAVYKQSIEGTKFAPKNLVALYDDKKVLSMKGHSGKAQTFNIWKSRSGKVELKGGSTPHAAYMTHSQVMNPQPPVIQVNMTALAKPPKQPSHPSSQAPLAAKQRRSLKHEEKKQTETIARSQIVEHQSSRQHKLNLQAQTLSPPALKHNESSVLSEENTISIQASIDHDGAARGSNTTGRGLHQFRHVMSGTKGRLPFERGLKSTISGLNSSQNIIKKNNPQSGSKHEGVGVSLFSVNTGMSAHRRHISQGMTPSQSITIGIQPPPQQIQALSTEPPLPNMTLENIEPDEDDQENFALHQGSGGHISLEIHGPTNQPSFATHLKGEDSNSISRITNKQIENMQVGRVRRKSGAAASHQITVPGTIAPRLKQEPSSGKKVSIPTTLRQIWGKLEYTNRSPESRQVQDKCPSTKKKEAEEKKVQIVTYQHIQAKTVESNSSESDDLSVQDVGTVGLGLPESHNSIFYPPQAGLNPRKYLEDVGHLRDSSEVQDAYQHNRTGGDHALDQTKQIVDLKKHNHMGGGGGNTVPHRIHSLSQYADHNQAKRLRPTLADLRSPLQAQSRGKVTLPRQHYQEFTPVSSIHNAQEAFSKEGAMGGASSPHQKFGGHHQPGAGSNAPTNNGMIKPLNKITWDSFSQIAKLSGDVDHEPSTPKSGRGGIKNSSDEENEIE